MKLKLILVVMIYTCCSLMPGTVFASPQRSLGDVIYGFVSGYQNPELANIITGDILRYSGEYDVDPLLCTAFLAVESGFNPIAESDTGAFGVAQLQPDTAVMLGVRIDNLHENIQGGISYFATQRQNFRKYGPWCLTYAIAAYNAGPGAIYDYNGVPPYRETQGHVEKVYNIHEYLISQMRS